MSTAHIRYGYSKTLAELDFDSTVTRVTAALKEQGFGVLATIDVSSALEEKLGVAFRRYTILGACNPPLAHRALQGEPAIGLLLPCNVVVAESADGTGTEVMAINAREMFKLVDNPEVASVAEDVDRRLRSALDAV